MALTQITTSGIANGAITATLINPSVQLGGPTISQIQITDSSYNVLDDTAVSTSGGYIKITGTGFAAGAIVVIGSVNATSTGFVSSTVLNVQVPALTAGTYTVYVVNTNGGTAIGVNGLTYSGSPTWVTASTLSNGVSGTPISIQLSATGDTPMTYALAAGNTLPSGLTLTSGGLLSGTVTVGIETVYAFTVVATDVQLQDSPRAFTITITVGDPYFYLTTLLLPGNGTNNGTNNTFLDSSTNAFTITKNGNTAQGTFSPFSQTGWGIYQPSITTDFISFTTSVGVNFQFPANFTIEAWVYPVSYGGTGDTSLWVESDGSTYLALNYDGSGNFNIYLNSGSATSTFASGIVTNQWNHVAMVRNGSTVTLYTNGVSKGTITNSATLGYSSPSINRTGGGAATTVRYMSNLRIVKGTAVYTSAFTPPTTPLTNIANTVLLTFQNNRYIDNSSNNFTPSVNGSISIQSFSPFAPTSSYTTSIVGGSAYFDGSGDNLTIAQNAAFTLGGSGNNFTIECYVYLNGSQTAASIIFSSYGDWNNSYNNMYALTANGSNIIWFNDFGNSGITAAVNLYSWNHIAIVRNSSTITMYINGVNVGTQTSGQNYTVANSVKFGSLPSSGTFNGYISSFRLVNGTAVYTSNFTPPAAPLTNITNTSLLCNFTNGQITDATSKNLLETVGDAKISTAESKWGGSSIYFDGTGDWLQIPYNEYYNIGSSDYTVEAWIKTTVTTGEIVSAFSSSSPFPGWLFGIGFNNNDGKLKFYNANGSSSESFTSTGTVNNNNWNHVAVTKSGTSLRFFINGTLDSTHTMTIVGTGSNQPILIGADNNSSKGRYYTGYINDLRITKGYARYTTNFTPPTSAFPTL